MSLLYSMNMLARVHGLDDSGWERHANPWSIWTRIPVLPLAVAALWARVWIGWWCLVPLLALVLWTVINPRAFPPPPSTNRWDSKAVLGERVWLNAADLPLPHHHVIAARITAAIAALGVPFLIWGVVALSAAWTLLGLALVLLGKLWFLDRMVWLFEDMARAHPPYRQWVR